MEMCHRLGFIGLGAMGAPMASNLAAKLAKDYKICIYDVSQEAMKSFVEAHGQSVSICHSPKEVSQGTVRFHPISVNGHYLTSFVGYHLHHAARRFPRESRLPGSC